MDLLDYLLPALAAIGLSLALTPAAIQLAHAVGALDQPGPRKVHSKPISRLGGLAVVASFGIVLVASSVAHTGPLAGFSSALGLGLLPVLLVSLWDDIRPLPPLPRLVCQLGGAAIVVSRGVSLDSEIHLFGSTIGIGLLAPILSVVWIVGVTNAFNLVDGLDGLAAGLASVSAVSLSLVLFVNGQAESCLVAAILAGALFGFLPYNTHPARTFLGDVGANSIGFMLACLALVSGSTLSAGFAILIPVLVLGVPVADTLLSMLRRLVRKVETGGKVGLMEADRGHIHHRLLDLGLDHRKAVFVLYGVGALLSFAALTSLFLSAKRSAIVLVTLILAMLIGVGRLGYDEFAILRRGKVLSLYEAPVFRKGLFVVFFDLVTVALGIYCAAGLKWDDWPLHRMGGFVFNVTLLSAPVTILCFWAFGLYRGAWRLANVSDFLRASSAVATASFASFIVCGFTLNIGLALPFWAIHTLLMLCAVNGARLSYRFLQARLDRGGPHGDPVLIYGAGLGGTVVLRELLANPAVGMRPLGFLDDDPSRAGSLLNGYRVFGTLEDLEGLLSSRDVKLVVVSSRKITTEKLRRAAAICDRADVKLTRMQIGFERVLSEDRRRVDDSSGLRRLDAPADLSGGRALKADGAA